MAVSRVYLDNVPHMKAFWIMLGVKLAQVSLSFGADDLGGGSGTDTLIYPGRANGVNVIIGTGNRANMEGFRQVLEVLRPMGVEQFLHLQIPYGYAHIDSIVSFVDKKTAIIDPSRVPWDVWNALKEMGVKLLEAPSPEETQNLALNFVALAPGQVIMASGNPQTKKFLEKQKIQVSEIDISELFKGWGSIHCMTAILKRDSVGKLF